jgi:hypothetical protein
MRLITTIIIFFLSIVILLGQERIASKDEYLHAKEVFKKQYKKEIYEKHQGTITEIDETIIKFNEELLKIRIHNDYKAIFLNGIFYPEIIVGYPDSTLVSNGEYINPLFRRDSLFITNFLELKKLNPNPQTKRFLFWVFYRHRTNPSEYYIELQNKKATKKTSISDFIKGATLTFFCHSGRLIM